MAANDRPFSSLTLGSYANVQPDSGLIDGWSAKTFLILRQREIWNASWIFREVFESRIRDRSLGNDLWWQPYRLMISTTCSLPAWSVLAANNALDNGFQGWFFLLSFFGNWVQLGCRSSRHMRVERTPAGDSNNFVSGLLQCRSTVDRSAIRCVVEF